MTFILPRALFLCLSFALIAGVSVTQAFAETESSGPLIPFKEFTLDNGLRLIVHEDHKAPIVAVNIWYHVGSRNERPGQTGYAHLFEHLMFQGSQNSGGEYLEILEKAGATDLNGTTWFDRTNYFQTVPTGALDRVLFLESDRMGHMLEAVDQAVLDEQRGVVQNEKRQGDNQPYNKVWKALLEQVFPVGHPYSWETIGSMEDLEAASLEEMQTWFKTYYGPNNAVLVVAGDVEAEDVLQRVERWFGDIPPGPPLSVQKEWIPHHDSERRQVLQDRVPQERIYIAWPGPRWGTTDAHQLGLAANILANGKNSRLYERLVYRDQVATDVGMAAYFLEISGMLILEISVKPSADIDEVEEIAFEEIDRLLAKGPSGNELKRVQTQERAGFIRGIERVGGFGGKSAVLAENAVYGNDAGLYQKALEDIASAKTADIRDVARTWLDQPPYVAHIVPFPQLSATGAPADRSSLPETTTPEAAQFPTFSRATLESGLEVIVVERPTVPVIDFSLIFNSGYAADPDQLEGTASLTMAMLDEGAAGMDALEISEQLAMLGASLGTGAGLDTASVSLSALTDNLEESLDLFAKIVQQPTFPEDELERLRAQFRTQIQQEKSSPTSMALRVLPRLLYGAGHPYAQPLTGSGTEASVATISRDDLLAWHESWFKPNNATLLVVGDTTADEIVPQIESLFSEWQGGTVPAKTIADVAVSENDTLYLIDKPGAEQSIVFASQLVVEMDNPDETAIEAFNDILGGQFSSRINMNLREEKHWSYGARSTIIGTRAQRPFFAYAPVQTDKTAESLAEILREIEEINSSNPPGEEELQRVQRSNTLSLSGRWETNGAVLGALAEIVSYDLPDDYWNTYADNLNNLTTEQVGQTGQQLINPNKLTWVVIGDRKRIETALRELNVGEIRLIDTDGNDADGASSE